MDAPVFSRHSCPKPKLRSARHPISKTNVVTLSTRRGRKSLEACSVAITSGPLADVSVRAVVVFDGNDRVLYSERGSEIKHEPDDGAALAAL